jgi:hypothetical protein
MRRFVLCAVLGTAMLSGCATNAAAPKGVTPPAMLSTNRPDFRLPTQPVNGTVLDLRIAVEIDSLGKANLGTLQVTGLGAADNRDVIERWISVARFQPARQAGRDVPGVFKTRVQLRGEVRRVRQG